MLIGARPSLSKTLVALFVGCKLATQDDGVGFISGFGHGSLSLQSYTKSTLVVIAIANFCIRCRPHRVSPAKKRERVALTRSLFG